MATTHRPTNTPSPDGDDAGLRAVTARLLGRVTRLETAVAGAVALTLLVLIVLEPDILGTPFASARALLFTAGGTVAAGVALVAMLWFRVPAPVRLVVLLAPFAAVTWWLVSPFFLDDVVNEEFATSIADQRTAPEPAVDADEAPVDPVEPTAEPTEPSLLGAGTFVGLAGHSGSGDAGIFRQPDGALLLRFERFDIQNGPDLEVYLVPGADQTSLAAGSIHLGALKGNVGDQSYGLPSAELAPGTYTALVWCEAFGVEFVAATITVG